MTMELKGAGKPIGRDVHIHPADLTLRPDEINLPPGSVYETGRTKPKPSILRRISQITGASKLVFFGEEIYSFSDLAGALGAYHEVGALTNLTDDEKAIIRIMRLCHGDMLRMR